MHDKKNQSTTRKQRILDEMVEYFLDVFYLYLLLGMFTLHKRLLLAEYQISSMHYGITLVESLILAKILVIGRLLRLDRPLHNRPLIFPTVYKALIFALLVGAFSVIEAVIRAEIHGQSARDALREFAGRSGYELFGKCLVSFFALIPFFGLKEVGRILGKGKLVDLFFRGRGK